MAITINGSTGISGVDGSVGTPAIIGSDADTGLVFAAGQVTASLNGTAANVALVSGTAQNSTSGTSIDFTGIPSWVKRVTVIFNGVSTNGTSSLLIQIGTSSGFTTSGYASNSCSLGQSGTTGYTASTAGFSSTTSQQGATNSAYAGNSQIALLGSNTWIASSVISSGPNGGANYSAGTVALSGTLDRVRITTVNGTNTFDAGSINIMYD